MEKLLKEVCEVSDIQPLSRTVMLNMVRCTIHDVQLTQTTQLAFSCYHLRYIQIHVSAFLNIFSSRLFLAYVFT
jgi:hypothetical protein